MLAICKLSQWLFQDLNAPQGKRDIWLWWEQRRFFYNLFVVATLAISFSIYAVCFGNSGMMEPDDEYIEPMLLGAIVFLGPIIWNIAFSLGPLVDVIGFATKRKFLGPTLMKLGLLFSFVLISMPAIYWAAQIIRLRLASIHF